MVPYDFVVGGDGDVEDSGDSIYNCNSDSNNNNNDNKDDII